MAATTMRPAAAVSCPQAIPSSWNLPAARLDGMRVLSHPANQPPANQPPANAETLPILAPPSEGTRAGTERYLRMDLPKVKQCTAAFEQRTKMVRFQCKQTTR
ncbi:hypothetical protein ABIE30_001589 [Janthinobacterium lividum]|uniref:hypothetical protein n=1 Tax=Janthinobacterium lividum TaxID=29581 RepID=UPI003D1B3EFE